MPARDIPGSKADRIARLVAEVEKRQLDISADCLDYVESALPAVDRALTRILAENLVRGSVFCEWGSGLGGVSAVAALNGFSPHGIEIETTLVAAARVLAEELELAMRFAEGTFLLPGDEDLASSTAHTRLRFDGRAWRQLELSPSDCDVVFAYPWPGDEACVDGVFSRHASAGALLVTFHGWDYLLVQRKVADESELATLGWM